MLSVIKNIIKTLALLALLAGSAACTQIPNDAGAIDHSYGHITGSGVPTEMSDGISVLN